MSWVAKTRVLVAKELLVESRARSTLIPMIVFSIAAVVLLSFTLPAPTRLSGVASFPVGTVSVADALAGFFWITILFAGLIGFARTFEAERELGALEVMLLVPLDRSGLYAAKAVANLLFLIAIQVVLAPLLAVFFGIDLGSGWAAFALVAVLVDIGFVASGTLFAAVAAGTTSRELLLPVLALPALVPVFIAAVELTSDLFVGLGVQTVAGNGWFGILVAFDVIFAVVGALAFEYALE